MAASTPKKGSVAAVVRGWVGGVGAGRGTSQRHAAAVDGRRRAGPTQAGRQASCSRGKAPAHAPEPGFRGVAPGRGVIMCAPVSVCHQVSTTDTLELPTTCGRSMYWSEGEVRVGDGGPGPAGRRSRSKSKPHSSARRRGGHSRDHSAHLVVPAPGLGVDGLAHGAQDAQAGAPAGQQSGWGQQVRQRAWLASCSGADRWAPRRSAIRASQPAPARCCGRRRSAGDSLVLGHVLVAAGHERADGGGRGVEHGHVVPDRGQGRDRCVVRPRVLRGGGRARTAGGGMQACSFKQTPTTDGSPALLTAPLTCPPPPSSGRRRGRWARPQTAPAARPAAAGQRSRRSGLPGAGGWKRACTLSAAAGGWELSLMAAAAPAHRPPPRYPAVPAQPPSSTTHR